MIDLHVRTCVPKYVSRVFLEEKRMGCNVNPFYILKYMLLIVYNDESVNNKGLFVFFSPT